MFRLLPTLCAAGLLAACSVGSNWYLMDEGYSINPVAGDGYAVEVHLNQLQQIRGDVNSAEFRHFVNQRLRWHGMCPQGWEPLPCVQDGSCVQHTRRSITVWGRCLPA